jgi:hypothetical protein
MNYYNIQYSPNNRDNNIQRIIYNKKIKIHGFRTLKQNINNFSLKLNNVSYKQKYKNH